MARERGRDRERIILRLTGVGGHNNTPELLWPCLCKDEVQQQATFVEMEYCSDCENLIESINSEAKLLV